MKYIKTYETVGISQKQKYNVGDWVKFYDKVDEEDFVGKITSVDILKDVMIGDRIYYQIKVFYISNKIRSDLFYVNNVLQPYIYRLLTEDEIDEIKMRMNTKKYNL